MDRSLLSAVSGIDANQTWLDVLGNNIANANTTGFKQDNVTFDALLNQQIEGATAPNGVGLGGANGVSVGTGVRTAAITPDESQGTLQQTNDPTDVFISGNGYLVANYGGTPNYTRDGTLMFDSNGNLVTPTGGLVQGWQGSNGVINTTLPIGNVTIPVGIAIPAQQTNNVNLGGNLPSGATAGTIETVTSQVYDKQGNAETLTMTYTAGPANTWTFAGTFSGGGAFGGAGNTLTFNGAGTLTGVTGSVLSNGVYQLTVTPTSPDAAGGTFSAFKLNFPATSAGQNNVTQYAGQDSLQALSQDGYASGSLSSLSVGQTGIITGAFTNGQTQQLGQLALATFANPTGLSQVGNNNWVGTSNSGVALIEVPGAGGAGTLTGGALESSNVSMSQQLTNLIVAQTSYQSNTRVVTTDATVLNSLIQMA